MKIDITRLDLIDTGDGIPLSKCEQNLYEALANLEDGIDTPATKRRIEDALADMGELVAEVKRLRKTIEDIENTAQDYDHPEVEEIISMCMWVMEPDSAGYNDKIPWKNIHSGDAE
jgi:hypothetical protein